MSGPRVERTEQLVVEITVSNLDRSLAQYTALGFELDRRDGGFAVLRWEDRRLFLSEDPLLPPVNGPSRGNVRIIVPDVDELWRRVCELRMPVECEIADRSYGLRDFSVLDPDGFGLRFASALPTQDNAEQQRLRVEGIDPGAMRVRDVPR